MPVIPSRLLTYRQRVARFTPIITRAFESLELNPYWGMALAKKESAFRPWVVNMTDPGDVRRGGSYGMFQMSLRTALDLGFHGTTAELLDPDVNAFWAARLVGQLNDRYQNLADVASCYNSGKPLSKLPAWHRTRHYVREVMRFAEEFKAEAEAVVL
jgi:soluble lytic murein transglycosylase-like protein